MSSSGGGIPVLQSMKMSSLSKPSTVRDLGFAVMKIVGYMGLGCLLYIFPELNSRPGEDDMPVDWSWDVIDCCYFTMVTITTVGYGDMPTLTQGMRIVTAFFGLIGVVAIAGALNVIAEWCAAAANPRAACVGP